MARYKHYDYGQSKLVPVSFEGQILPGSFEDTLCRLIDHELDLRVFEERYSNDEEGAPAYDPAILLKIVLLAYSRGVTSSRRIARLCEQNVMFMAISADSRPHFTTIAHFVSSSHEEIGVLFREVVLICDELGLIGGNLFAVDGCKLPSNASKEWSGTRGDLEKKVGKLDRAVRRIVSRHQRMDRKEERTGRVSDPSEMEAREKQQVKKLRKVSRKLKHFLATHEEKIGTSGKPIQSNVTDNESAKMKTSRGVIQGYIGVAGVDGKNQVVVHAEVQGQPQEHSLLKPAVEGLRENLEQGSKSEVAAARGEGGCRQRLPQPEECGVPRRAVDRWLHRRYRLSRPRSPICHCTAAPSEAGQEEAFHGRGLRLRLEEADVPLSCWQVDVAAVRPSEDPRLLVHAISGVQGGLREVFASTAVSSVRTSDDAPACEHSVRPNAGKAAKCAGADEAEDRQCERSARV
jgi:transposase